MTSKLLVLSILLASGIVNAGQKMESVQNIDIPADINRTEVLSATDKRVSCVLKHDRKKYKRLIKLGSSYEILSTRIEVTTEPTLEDMLDNIFKVYGLDLSNQVNSIPELITLVESKYGVVYNPYPRHLIFFKLKSDKTALEYEMVCDCPKTTSLESVLGLLAEKGKLSPIKDL